MDGKRKMAALTAAACLGVAVGLSAVGAANADHTGSFCNPVNGIRGAAGDSQSRSPRRFTRLPRYRFCSRSFTRAGQSSARTLDVSRSAATLSLSLDWEESDNRFTFSSVQALGSNNRVLADLGGTGGRAKLETTRRSRDATGQSFTVRKPKGTRKLRFRVRAKRVATSERALILVTQYER